MAARQSRLEKNLDEWSSQGLITRDQVRLIQSYEDAKPASHPMITALIGLGCLVIGIGIISLIASNWRAIPAFVKLVADFALVGGIAVGIYRESFKANSLKHDGLMAIQLLLIGGSIGLVAQLFHTDGEAWQALVFWTLISLPMALFSRQGYVPFAWSTLLLGTIWSVAETSRLFSHGSDSDWLQIWAGLPLLAALFSAAFKKLGAPEGFANAFRNQALLFGLFTVFVFDLGFSLHGFSSHSHEMGWPVPVLCLLASCLVATMAEYAPWRRGLLIAQIWIYALSLFLVLEVAHDHSRSSNEFLGAAFSIVTLLLAAGHFGTLGYARVFNIVTAMIGLRFLIVYFQAFGGLAATGIGLIVSGLLILGVVALWAKKRHQLRAWVERLG